MANDRKVLRSTNIAEEIRRRIQSGVYCPHTYLPGERELAREFCASRSTVAAALDALAKDEFVAQTQGRGTRVLPLSGRLGRNTVGVVHGFWPLTGGYSPENALILKGVEDTLLRFTAKHELVPLVRHHNRPAFPLNNSLAPEEIETLGEHYDALIFIETFECEKDVLSLYKHGIPLAVANLEVDIALPATWVDHQKTTRSAVELLVSLGHRRISYIGRNPIMFFYAKAKAGYLAGLAEAGIPSDEALVPSLGKIANSVDTYFAARSLLELAEPPTAFVVARDHLAQGVCRAVTEAGLTLGQDVSVIGFDDITWQSEEIALTTFREPAYELGAQATEILAQQLENKDRSLVKQEIEAPLILRSSVGPPQNNSHPRGKEVALKFITEPSTP